jgi:hypothetical protein
VTAPDPVENLGFLRALHDDAMAWYRGAESKGQILLTVDGVIITVLAGIVFGDPAEVGARIDAFGPLTRALLGTTAAALLGSLLAAAMCLRSRLQPVGSAEPVAANAWWFGSLARMDPGQAVDLLQAADLRFEREALAAQLPVLSRNVLAKHRWANAGWALTAAALACLVGSAAGSVLGT